ncbi:hypothetical protein C6499_20290 [Candidatus Poribacteria bacterium]|nr:MAG: hypothetical protein C6499_20290 [Candidatus Poribacteria bacterium]
MARNSVTGRFRDIEIAFTIDGDATMMSVRNLVNEEKRVRVMYQKLAASGLANWANFQLTNAPVLRRLPTEILEAYRLTFFVDDADPVSARIEKIVDELNALKPELPAKETPENTPELNGHNTESITADQDETRTLAVKPPEEPTAVPATPALETHNSHGDETLVPEDEATQQIEAAVEDILQAEISELVGTSMDENELPESDIEAAEQVETVPPYTSEADTPESVVPENGQKPEGKPTPTPIVMKLPKTQNAVPVSQIVDSNLEFRITVPALPPSVRIEQRKAQAEAHLSAAASRRKEKGVFGQLAQALGLTAGGRRGKAYYREKGEAIQNEFQDQLAKLERDYNEGYGLNLLNWDIDKLDEEEIAILLLNLMVNEVIAWQKETGRPTSETEQLVQTLADVDTRLRQTLKQTRGAATPSPTLFPDLLAENERDLEKIQNECDAYLQRFASKLTEQEKDHAVKIEVLMFKKFLIEFIRDYLFVEVAKSTQGNELPERLNWFLDLVNSEVIPIEVGKTKVSPKHHKVKRACASEFEAGTIAEIVTHGLQSKDGKRINQMAVVIEAE